MEPTSLSDNIAFLIGDISHRLHRKVSRIISEDRSGVTIEQFSILTALWYQEGLRQQDLAKRLNRDKTTMTRVIDKTIRQKLVARVPDKTDRRAYRLYLTSRGRNFQNRMVKTTGRIYLELIDGIPDEELTETVNVLNRMISNLK